MASYPISRICEITSGRLIQNYGEKEIQQLVYDTRRILHADSSIFFALKTSHNNGHHYLGDAHKKGIRNFIVSDSNITELPESNVILVNDCLEAMQALAAYHRKQFSIPVIGITGSNGKTIVKEWLYHLLQDDEKIVRSPRSFNSQLGVALSLWQINEQHSLGIFEAGISKPGEMDKLEKMIKPSIGVLTNIGEAHSEGFDSMETKLEEKLRLFAHSGIVIFGTDSGKSVLERVSRLVDNRAGHRPIFSWGTSENARLSILKIEKKNRQSTISTKYEEMEFDFQIPFTDDASIENAMSCISVMLVLGYEPAMINLRLSKLHAIDMRLQLNHSFNECMVINDSYSADITSLKMALDFQKQQSSGLKRTVILSDFFESSKTDDELYGEISQLLKSYRISKLIAIGEKINQKINGKLDPSIQLLAFLTPEDFIRDFRTSQFYREILLIKGARKFGFERIAKLFEKKLHQTVLEINLNALSHNLKEYQKLLKPSTRIMAMVKAFSYGSGGAEIASILQFHNTSYLGVAYADEGVELVKAGITIPIMVMNVESSSFDTITNHHLEPVIYSHKLLEEFKNYLDEEGLSDYPVHLEIETGMNRLGFTVSEINQIAAEISSLQSFSIRSVFTHLAASEDPAQDEFTREQAALFDQAIDSLKKYISYPFLKHISNSAAIVRHPHLQHDMVRLGIGLYGIEIDNDNLLDLQAVATLRSTIAQLKLVKKGESVSYNRRGKVDRDSLIATVRIGYADGYSRDFSNGKGKMWLRDKLAPVIGTVCMDMTMIDVTDIPGIQEGDEVIVFGPQLPVQQLATMIKTIPYEIMTGVSQRVKRVYFHE